MHLRERNYCGECLVPVAQMRRIAAGWGETPQGVQMRALLTELNGGERVTEELLLAVRMSGWHRTRAKDGTGDIIWALHDECLRRREEADVQAGDR